MKKIITVFLVLITLASAAASAEAPGADAPGVMIIPIDGGIDRPLTVFIRRSLSEADDSGAKIVILEINTFGGLVESALQIATLIGAAEQQTIAYIPAAPETTGVSWSAGALISFACSRIYMAPGTSIGAAAPVYTGAEGPVAAEEKTVSAVRAQMAALAEKNGYPRDAALAMVDSDIELIEVYVDGELRLIDSADLEITEAEAERDGKSFLRGRTISKEGKLLTFTALDMEKYGISSGSPESREELFSLLGTDESAVIEAETSVPDRLVATITGGSLTAILIMIGLGALYLEITSPGFGVPGTVAIIIFAVLFASNAMLGFVGSLEIILFLLGIILLLVEIFLIPGFGAAGISGLLLITASLVLSRQDFILPEFEWQTELLQRNLLNIGAGILGSIVFVAIFFQIFPRTGLFNRLVLSTAQNSDDGYSFLPDESAGLQPGQRGRAVTTLRPSGKAEFAGGVVAVETDGDYIEAGAEVEITAADSNRIIVRRC